MRGSKSNVVLPGLIGEVGGIIRRHFWVAVIPAAVLGAGADALELLRHDLGAQIALALAMAMAFEFYVAYAELIVATDRSAGPWPKMRTLLAGATPRIAVLVLASAIGVSLPLAATGLLVIPGFWLLTRWSLFAPAIVHERLSVLDSLRRSSELVRGAFWVVAFTVTGSLLIEHAVIHATVHTAEPLLGGKALGLVGAALATMIVSTPAAFTISVVYERLERAPADARAEAGAHTPPLIKEHSL